MIQCLCVVQEGQISANQEAILRTETSDFAQRNFGAAAEIQWLQVPEGSGFTEGVPSTSVIVNMTADRSLAPSEREPLLRELGQIWERHAERGPDEVVTAIRDPSV
ncbi:MAG: hypothetical protein AAF494_02135 [Pseudomonadota bacterium]